MRDVVIVGAGPVGLTLALGLARKGIDVLVLEKNAGTADYSRAPAIWPASQEILATLGVMERFEAEGISLPRIELVDHDRQRVILTLPVEELRDETDFPRLLIVPQSRTEALLCETLREETGAVVQFSSEVMRIRQSSSAVELTYRQGETEKTVHARFVAGCDGARSTLRKAIGSSFEGLTYATQAALADIEVPESTGLPFPRMTTRPRLAVAIRIDQRLWRLILPFTADDQRSKEQRIEDAVSNLFPPLDYTTVWESEFHLHRRVSSSWVDGRVVLAGDAAHLNSPVGGQGMNAGIMDADLLTTALQTALDENSREPLQRYVIERKAAIEGGVNPFTNGMTRILLAGGGRTVRPSMRLINLLLHIPPLRKRILRRLAMLKSIRKHENDK
ncbi:MAG: FAD-dependent monooxygenase [Acidobacteria bacterium]|nr:FAD-dependent monooxygenase [Acidobacteriota bacterium]